MSPPKATSTSGEDEEELDRIADELYALPTDAFVGARDGKVADAKARGRQPLARELGKLRRPTQSAWLVNLLWRHARADVDELLGLGDALSRAQEGGSAADLRRLASRRGELQGELVARARTLGERADVSVTAAMEREVEDTLAAALADPDVAAELRTGRVVKPAAYAGFGFGPSMAVAAPSPRPKDETQERSPRRAEKQTNREPPSPEPRREEPDKTAIRASASRADREEARAAERAERRRAEAEEHARVARAALEKASSVLDDRVRESEEAQERERVSRSRLESLRSELREAEKDARAAENATGSADRERQKAERARDAAAQALEHAEALLAD